MDFKLPDIGEGVHEGEIVKWLVKEGDTIAEDQPMVEVMTDKATVEIPSPVKGKIEKIYHKAGTTITVDTVMVTIAEAGDAPAKKSKGVPPKVAPNAKKSTESPLKKGAHPTGPLQNGWPNCCDAGGEKIGQALRRRFSDCEGNGHPRKYYRSRC